MKTVCIGREIKSGETRVALTQKDAGFLRRSGVTVALERYPNRVWADREYSANEIPVVESSEAFDVVLAIKEFNFAPGKELFEGQIVCGFHHVHKGQTHNLPSLRRALELRASLFDYELCRLDDGRQPITTSFSAGQAGAINALWAYGQTQRHGRDTYPSLNHIPTPAHWGTENAVLHAVDLARPPPSDLKALIIGTGECARGAADVFRRIMPDRLITAREAATGVEGPWWAVLGTHDVVCRYDGGPYERENYREEGARAYMSTFERFIGRHSCLIFCPYWDARYPKLLPRELLSGLSEISCEGFQTAI